MLLLLINYKYVGVASMLRLIRRRVATVYSLLTQKRMLNFDGSDVKYVYEKFVTGFRLRMHAF